MQDKRPLNEKKEPHGHWVVNWSDNGGYVCHYINGLEYGLDNIDWGFGDKEQLYYAR